MIRVPLSRITEQSRSTKEENKEGKAKVHHYYTDPSPKF
jgi:hypothetical protein